ncbi:MAG: PAS domain-containing protein [Candidatus Acidiferrales bacterium]
MKHKRATEVSSNWGQFAASQVFTEPEQVLAGFFSTSTVGLAICDNELRFQAINNTLATMNGIPSEAHLGKTLRNILGTASARIEPAFRRVLVTGQAVLNFEITAQLSTRIEVGHWIGNYFPIRDSTGRVEQVGAFVVEVTQQKKLEESICSFTSELLRVRANDRRRIVRELHDSTNQCRTVLKTNLARLRRPHLESDERAKLLAQSVRLLEHCILETRTAAHSDLRYDIFRIVPGTSSVTRVGSADDLEKAKAHLARLASAHHADYFACDKSTGDIVVRTHFLPTKSNTPRIKP